MRPTTTWDYVHDEARRLSVVSMNSTTQVTYSYYPSSPLMRSRHPVGGVRRLFILDGPNVFEEQEAGAWGMTTTKARYPSLDAIDHLIARRDVSSGGIGYFLGDQLNSVHYITNASGTIANSYTYRSFGALLSSSETTENRYGFTQREGDAASALYFYRNRWYTAAHGRFTQADPLGSADGINRYIYVHGNPINFDDATGLKCQCVGLKFDRSLEWSSESRIVSIDQIRESNSLRCMTQTPVFGVPLPPMRQDAIIFKVEYRIKRRMLDFYIGDSVGEELTGPIDLGCGQKGYNVFKCSGKCGQVKARLETSSRTDETFVCENKNLQR